MGKLYENVVCNQKIFFQYCYQNVQLFAQFLSRCVKVILFSSKEI